MKSNELHRTDNFLSGLESQKPVPRSVLLNATFNKGTAFTLEERDRLGLRGLLPPTVETIEQQEQRVLLQLEKCHSPIDKYNLLTTIRRDNETLFYRVLTNNLKTVTPIVYTPVVGQACQEFSQVFKWGEGLFISKQDKGNVRRVLDNWTKEVSIIVVSDGSRILGLGDLGAGGMGIPIGKLQLYVAAAGFHPSTTLPILIDTGTNTKKYIDEPTYIGLKHPRLPNEEYYPLLDEFLMAVKDKWPKALLQFEDFSNDHCFELLERYENKLRCFNDDIQGTGAVIASGFLNAIKITGADPTKLKIVFYGAGSAGTGVADEIVSVICLTHQDIQPEQARKNFYFLDSKGLVTTKRGGNLESHKVPYARDDYEKIGTLLEVIKEVKPQVLIGLSGQGGSFTKEILEEMGKLNERPIIFSLSNPTANSECSAEAAYLATGGRAIFASGSPYDPVTLPDGRVLHPGQGNNMYIFPGLGFGAWLCQSTVVSRKMVTASAVALAETVTREELAKGLIYPPIAQIREISAFVATRVIEQAFVENVANIPKPENILHFVKGHMYQPSYL